MKKRIFLMFFCSISLCAFAQTFTIKNISNGKEKTFKPGGFYEIVLAENGEVLKNNCCDWSILKGSLASFQADSFQLNLKNYERRMIVDDMKNIHENDARKGSNYGSFAKNDIFSIRHFKSEKIRKRKAVLTGLGAVFVSTGILTALNTFTVRDSDSKKTLLRSGGVQAGAGIVMMIAGSSKKYQVKGDGAIWELN